jgi:hypothetical protein
MQCPKRGTKNPDDAQVCQSCSSELPVDSITAQHQTPMTSALAILSFAISIMSIFLFPIVLIAIIFGIVSIFIIKKSNGRIKGTGFAILGLVISIFVLLIYTPVVLKIRRHAFRTICGENLSGLGKAMLSYTKDHNGTLPTSSKWCDLLIEHTEMNSSTLRCKKAKKGPCNYAFNKNIVILNKTNPYNIVLLYETHPGWNQSGGPEILTTENHDGEGCMILFMDLHVEFVRKEDLKDLKWEPD